MTNPLYKSEVTDLVPVNQMGNANTEEHLRKVDDVFMEKLHIAESLASRYSRSYELPSFVGLSYDDLFQDLSLRLYELLLWDCDCTDKLIRTVLRNHAIDRYRSYKIRSTNVDRSDDIIDYVVPSPSSNNDYQEFLIIDTIDRMLNLFDDGSLEQGYLLARVLAHGVVAPEQYTDKIKRLNLEIPQSPRECDIAKSLGLSLGHKKYYSIRRTVNSRISREIIIGND